MENQSRPTLEDLLSTMDETLKAIQTHKGPIHVTPELLADIGKLEVAVRDFKEANQLFFELFDIDIHSLKKEVLESPNTRSSDKQLIKRSEDIEREGRVTQLALSKAKSKRRAKGTSSSAEKQQQKERRKLFKSLGGNTTWLPL